MKCAIGHCGHCMLGPAFVCKDGPVFRYDRIEPFAGGAAAVRRAPAQARGVEVRLLRRLPAQHARPRGRAARLAGEVEIAYFLEARRQTARGPYDLSLVEGSVTTPEDAERIRARPAAVAAAGDHRRLRHRRRHPGAAQLRRRRGLHVGRLREPGVRVDARRPRRRSPTTCTSTSSSRAARSTSDQLLEVISAYLNERRPAIASHSVCMECKRRGNVCVMVAHGTPCLGPVTHAGCGAICPVLRPRLLRLLRARWRTPTPSR